MADSHQFFPFGFQQGDPLVVCINYEHMCQVQLAFQLRAYYCLPFSAIVGRRHSKVILFRKPFMSDTEERRFKDWLMERVITSLEPNGKMYFV